jgi:hypothetical protein
MYADYYHDVNRRVSLKLYSTEYYLKMYTQRVKSERKNKVIVCFSCNKSNMPSREFVHSLLDQSYKIDELVMIVPYREMGGIPEDMKKIFAIHGYSKDYGDAANIVCAVLREPESHTKIIIVESNRVYGQDFVHNMVVASDKYPDNIIYGHDTELKYGVLIKPKFFDDDVSKYESGQGCCPWIEKCRKVDKKVINYDNVI